MWPADTSVSTSVKWEGGPSSSNLQCLIGGHTEKPQISGTPSPNTDKTFPAFPGSGSALDGDGRPVWILGVIPLVLRKRCLAGETVGLGCGSRFWAENEGFTKGPGLAPSSFSYIASHTWRFGGRQRGGAGKRTVEKVSCTQ